MSTAVTGPGGVTCAVVLRRLAEQGVAHTTLRYDDGQLLVVSGYGARVYGPFADEDSPAANWLPEVFADAEAFADAVRSRWWNLGGERLWVGPEIQYMIPDRADYWGSYHLPTAMDPGGYTLLAGPDGVDLAQSLVLRAHSLASGEAALDLTVRVRRAADPLAHLRPAASLRGALRVAGYTQEVTVTCASADQPVAEAWNLQQVRPGGVAMIPAVPQAEVTDYYEPSAGLVDSLAGGVVARITGDRRYKVGLASPQVFGRVGYLRRTGPGGRGQLLVRSFTNRPGARYAEEPDFAPGLNGDSVHLYNDDGALGGFGELEARGGPVGRGTGALTGTDTFTSWWFSGDMADLRVAAHHLLGQVGHERGTR